MHSDSRTNTSSGGRIIHLTFFIYYSFTGIQKIAWHLSIWIGN